LNYWLFPKKVQVISNETYAINFSHKGTSVSVKWFIAGKDVLRS